MFPRRVQLMRHLIARHPGRLALIAAFLLALALAILLIGLALLANPETWYFRTAGGAACGNGDRESLSESAGSSAATKVLDSTGATWNRTETTRSIGAGNWQVLFDATTGSGSGPTNKVTVLVERRNSACSVQQEIINEELTLTEGTTTEYSTTVTDPGQVSFDTGDILTVTLNQTKGKQTVTLRYNDTAGGEADSRLAHPAEAVVTSVSDITNFTEVIAAALGFTRTETTNVGDSIMSALAQGVSETVGLLESVAVTTAKNFSLADSAGIVESISTTLGYPQTETTALGDSIRSALAKGVSETASLLESVSDIIAKNFSLTDSAGIVESLSATLGFPQTETTALVDSVRSGLAKGVSETASLLESIALRFARADTASLAEFLGATLGLAHGDTATIAESIAGELGFPRIESSSLLESIQSALGSGVSDAAGLLDSIALLFQHADTAALAESLATALGSAPVGSAKLSESFGSTLGSRISDIASIVETMTTTLGLIPTEAANLSESLVSTLGSRISDTASIVESMTATLGLIRTEAANLSESLVSTLDPRISDTASIVESMTATLGLIPTEATKLSESLVSTLGSRMSDTASIVESMTASLGLIPTEAAKLSESVVSTLGSRISDTSNLSESLGSSVSLRNSDRAKVFESVVSTLGSRISDTASIVESMTATLGLIRTEVANLSESLVSTLGSRISDTVGIVESMTASLGLIPTEAANLSESLVSTLGSRISDTASMVESMTAAVGPIHTSPANLAESIAGALRKGRRTGVGISESVAFAVEVMAGELTLAKVDAPDPVLVGNVLTYTITVSNDGPSDTTGVVVRDRLPPGLSFESARSSRGSCVRSSGTVTCELGNFNSGDTATVTIAATPLADAGGTTITNIVSVVSNETDPDSPVTVTTQSTKVKKKVDLAVTMSDLPNGVITGNTMKYTATVTNHGPSDATGVILTGALPEGVTFASATPSQGNCQQASGTISCNLGVLNNAATATIAIIITVQVVVNPGETGSVTNTVTAGGNETEPVRGNNTAVTVTEVHRDSDKDGIGDGVENEAPNNGDGDGDGVPDKDQLNVTSLRNNTDERFATIKSPQGTELADVVARGNPSPDDAPDEVFSAGFFAFRVEGLEKGGSVTIDVFFSDGTLIDSYWKYGPTVDDPLPHWYEFLFDGTTGAESTGNRVTLHFVDGLRGDDDLTANGQIVDVGGPVFDPANLSVTKTDSADPVLVGDTLTYTVTVTNTGPSNATGIILTDRLPAVMSFRSATLSQGSCSLMSDVVTCSLGTIDVGANAAVVITVTPLSAESGFSVTNTASVEAVEPDSDSTNNTASQSTMVARKVDLSVMQKDTPDPVLEGESLTYTVTVTNNGPSQATGVVLTDTLPAAVTFVSVIPTQGNCTHESRVVSCLLKALDSGASTEVTIAVKLQKVLAAPQSLIPPA